MVQTGNGRRALILTRDSHSLVTDRDQYKLSRYFEAIAANSLVGSGLEAALDASVPAWIERHWPLKDPRYVGRDLTWRGPLRTVWRSADKRARTIPHR